LPLTISTFTGAIFEGAAVWEALLPETTGIDGIASIVRFLWGSFDGDLVRSLWGRKQLLLYS